MRFYVLNVRLNKFVMFFDFVDTETGLEYSNFRLVQKRDGSHFVASPGAEFQDGPKGTKTKDYVRIARTVDWTESPRGRAWMNELRDAAIEARAIEVKQNQTYWTQEDWDRQRSAM
jgi:hypothetical protein